VNSVRRRSASLGRQVGQVQLLFGLADLQVGLLQHGRNSLSLSVEVVVDQALVERGALGDALHARAAQAVFGELVACGLQDGGLGPVRVALAGGDRGFDRAGERGRGGWLGHGMLIHQLLKYIVG
jgi:hypothetical protein